MDKRLPKDYFQQLPPKIWESITALEDNLKMEAPVLFSLGKEEPYSVPAGYFENNLVRLKSPNKQVQPKFWKPWIGLAASLSILLAAYFVYNHYSGEAEPQTLELEELFVYYEANPDEFSELLIDDLELVGLEEEMEFEQIADEELDGYWDYILSDFSDEELIDFL